MTPDNIYDNWHDIVLPLKAFENKRQRCRTNKPEIQFIYYRYIFT